MKLFKWFNYENEIINVVEEVEKDNYQNLFKENYVTQTTPFKFKKREWRK